MEKTLPIVIRSVSQEMTKMIKRIISEEKINLTIADAKKFKGIEEIIKNFPDSEVFITRGYVDSKNSQDKSVVSMQFDSHDIIKKISELSHKGVKKIGVIGVPAFIGQSKINYHIGDIEVAMLPTEREATEDAYIKLLNSGFQGFIGGSSLRKICERDKVEFSFLDNNIDSIRKSIIDAVKIYKIQVMEKEKTLKRMQKAMKVSNDLFVSIENVSVSSQKLSTSSNELANISKQNALDVDDALEAVKATYEVIEMVKNISNKTNLLSLNAKIEASRTGEAGKGFSVVADEIRKLADKTANEAGKIHELLSELTNRIEHISKNTNLISTISAEQAEANENEAANLAKIQEIGDELVDLVKKI